MKMDRDTELVVFLLTNRYSSCAALVSAKMMTKRALGLNETLTNCAWKRCEFMHDGLLTRKRGNERALASHQQKSPPGLIGHGNE